MLTPSSVLGVSTVTVMTLPVTHIPLLPGLVQFALNVKSHFRPPLNYFLLTCGFKRSPLSEWPELSEETVC